MKPAANWGNSFVEIFLRSFLEGQYVNIQFILLQPLMNKSISKTGKKSYLHVQLPVAASLSDGFFVTKNNICVLNSK